MWHTPDAQQWKQGLCVDPLCGSHSDVLTLIWSTEQNSSIMTRRVKLISQNAHGTRQNKNVTWVSVKKTPWDWTRGFGARVYAAMDRPKEREKRERRNWGSGCLFVNMWARRCVASWWLCKNSGLEKLKILSVLADYVLFFWSWGYFERERDILSLILVVSKPGTSENLH
mgnify:FL=1